MADVAEVKDAFESQGYALDSKVIADEAFALCRQFNLDATDLALHWDGFSVEQASKKDKRSLMPDASNIEAFKLHVERKVAERRKSTSMRTPKSLSYSRPNLMESLEKNPRALEESGAFASITPGRGGTTPGAKTSAAKAAYAGTAPSAGPSVPLPEVDARGALEAHAAAPGASAYAKRAGSRSVKTELGANLPTLAQAPDTRRPPVAVRVVDAVTNLPALAADVRFMRDRIGDKVDMLERRIGEFRRETERVTGEDASRAVYAASQDDVTVVGRVVCDSEGRLNEASVQLEGCVANSAGMRVRLELRDVPSFSLFPGQIVRVTGANPSGHCLVAKSIVAHAPPPMCRSPSSSPAFGAQSVVIASGPFTCAADLSYEPFADLLRYCEERRPDSVVLCGPFVDEGHRVVRGDAGVDVPFEKVFEVGVKDRLADFARRCEAGGYAPNVVLVPSVRDAVADPVFPQPPLELDALGLDALLPERSSADREKPAGMTTIATANPGTFTINGVRVAACTHDVLRHLSAAEAAREDKSAAGPSGGSDRMARLASHLPGQRSAYPLFPAAHGACLDASLAPHLAMEKTPDVLVLPSDLQPFAKVCQCPGLPAGAEGTRRGDGGGADGVDDDDDARFVAINPGRLAKGNVGGTLAHVYVSEGAPEPGASGASVHAVHARARVDIVRI